MTGRVLQILAVVALAASGLPSAHAGEPIPLRAEQAWVRAAPPGVTVLAGYLTLINDSAHDIDIVAVSSPDFRRIEMHRSVSEGGVARMIEQDVLTVPARGRLVLEPGGLHLMLMMPAAALQAGDTVTLSLQLAEGRSVDVDARVGSSGEP